MKPMDTDDSAGVIAPGAEDVDTNAIDQPPAAGVETVEQAGRLEQAEQAVQDLPLPQLPEDAPPIEPPEFVLSRRISEDGPGATTVPAGLPGLGGQGAQEPQDILSGAATEPDELLDTAGPVLGEAGAPVLDATRAAMGSAAGAADGAAPMAAPTGAASSAAAPSLPGDPTGALLSGEALPALPGVDLLFEPIRELLSSFGTGVMGALDPTAIMSQSSKIIEAAMQVGRGGMSSVEQLWESQAARNAQAAGQEANNTGAETSQRGVDISELTQHAAAVVQQGNAQLTTIASSFATQASALAPVIMTPPAQTALIASATEHLGQAVGVTNSTRGDLAGKTAELNGLVQHLLGNGAGPQPQEVAQAMAQNVGQPMAAQAQDAGSSLSELQSSSNTDTDPSSTTTAGFPGSSTGSPGTGAPGGPGSAPGSPGLPSSPPAPGAPGAPLGAGMRPPTGLSGMPAAGPGAASASTGSGFMGSPAAAGAGQRNTEEEHARNVETYQSPTGTDDLTGPLGESTPEVIGAVHSDESEGNDYNQDQF